jgi:hypothetical protein
MAQGVLMGGMKITDHKFFAGSGSPKFPIGNKTKDYSSAEGAGAVGEYEDTSEKIKGQQDTGIRKAESHKQKPQYRN